MSKRIHFILIILVFFVIPFSVFSWGGEVTFFVEKNYDLFNRNTIDCQLLKTTNRIYFYVEKEWYSNLKEKNQLDSILYNLANEFEYKIYPTLTASLGSEDNPGIDGDPRIIVVLAPFKENFNGYIRERDRYSRNFDEKSNEGQIIYLNSNSLFKDSFETLSYELAHEFSHLIVLKQKPYVDTWYYEFIAEFSSVLLDYDKTGSFLRQRAQSLSYLTELKLKDWENREEDYGKVRMLVQYLMEQFGESVILNTLKYPSNDPIESLNDSLRQNGIFQSFDDIFLNWLIANVINDCRINKAYCYQNPYLKNFKVTSYTYYLPTQDKSSLSVTDSLDSWSAKFQKIMGGDGILNLKFALSETASIKRIPYITEDIYGNRTVNFIDFTTKNTQEVFIDGMGRKYVAVYFLPFIGANSEEEIKYYYSWQAINLASNKNTELQIIESLLKQIEFLKEEIAKLQAQSVPNNKAINGGFCSLFTRDLYFGMKSEEVKCLQQFLANLGEEIYPEKLVTGYYGPLTQKAVQRYQAMKGIIATGYFGPLTRAKVNQEL